MKIAVAGALGRVGRTLIDYIPTCGHELIGGTVRPGQEKQAEALFNYAGVHAPLIHTDISIIYGTADAVIDFTSPGYSCEVAYAAAEAGKPHICGTTGLSAVDREKIAAYAKQSPIVHAPNMSIGINLLLSVCEQVARALDESFDAEIYEMHHKHKIDAPSGTALALGRAVAQGRGGTLEELAEFSREGITGERLPGRIGFSVARGGDVIGDHTVTFAGTGERIELTHRASSRQIYARGAVKAAEWALRQPPGLYGMQDVLNLRPQEK